MTKSTENIAEGYNQHRAETELDTHQFDRFVDNSEEGVDLLYREIEKALG